MPMSPDDQVRYAEVSGELQDLERRLEVMRLSIDEIISRIAVLSVEAREIERRSDMPARSPPSAH